MMRRRNRFAAALADLPWWRSLALAAAVYLAVGLLLPPAAAQFGIAHPALDAIADHAWLFAAPLLIAAMINVLQRMAHARLLAEVHDAHALRALDTADVETLAMMALRGEGWKVARGTRAPDGVIRFALRRADAGALAECLHAPAQPADTAALRALHERMLAARAAAAIHICSGGHDAEARAWAAGKPLRLIDADALLALAKSSRRA